MNKSVFGIDFRHNEGHTESIKKKLALIMLKNIERAYKLK